MADFTKDRGDLAGVLAAMPFGELMKIATELVAMNEDKDCDRNIKTPLGMAETLWDWAESEFDNQ